jgi:PAS domain S-box-containing protein
MADITKIDTLIQSSPHPPWLATTHGHCVHANAALEDLTGFNSDQIHQADWRSFLLVEDRAVASASWQRSLATETPYRVQVRTQPLDRFRVRGSQLCWLFLLLVVTFNQWPLSLGQTPPSVNIKVGHDSWTFQQGAPADVVCLAQTNDGFLWLGSPNGLFRFDGMRFEPFSSPFGDRLLSNNLYSLFAPPSGGLWIGYTFGGFSFLDKGRVTNYASGIGSVYGFAQDRDGIVWAGTSTGLWRFDHSTWQNVGVEWNAPAERVMQVGFDSEGILWALVGGFEATKDLIYLIPGTGHFKTASRNLSVNGFTWKPDRTILTAPVAPRVSDSAEGSAERLPVFPATRNLQIVDRNNSVWISLWDKPVVMRLPKDNLRDVQNEASPAISETYNINPSQMAQLVDREGNIWFGDTRGIHRFFYTPLIRQEFPQEASEQDFAVVADDHGAVWVSFGSYGASVKANLYHVLGGKAEHRLPQVSLSSSFSYRAPDKTFWFSGERCLWHLVGSEFVRVNLPPEVVNEFGFLQTITADRQGGIWVSFGRHGLYRLANGSWIPYGGRDDLTKTGTYLMTAFTDSLGRVWFGYAKSQLAVLDGDRVRRFGPSDDLQVGNITAIYGRGPKIWIGGEFGLEQFDQGSFHKIAAVDDQWLRGISGVVETPEGDLWLNAISGIFHIRKAEISEALKDSAYRVKGEHFGIREGLSGIANQLRPLPTAIEGTDGRLWFALHNGVVWLDPTAYSEKRMVPPPITIQSVSADDKGYAPDPRLSLPAHTSSVQISYTAVSLSDPEAIRFRYKLQETDEDWHEAAAATPVTYRNLPPGSYHFSVEASDTNGDWSGAPANLAFTIQPAFYQTAWFRSLVVFLFLAALTGLYRRRLRQLERQRDALRKSEKELRDVIDTIPAIVWSTLPDGSNTYVNKRFVEYSGLSAKQTAGSGGRTAIHPDDVERSAGKWMEAVATGKPHENELRLRRSDGQYRWHLTRGVPLRDEDGNIVRWYGVTTDIEDRKRAEEALEVLSRDLQESKAKLEEAQRIAHIGYWEWDLATNRLKWSDETYRIYGMRPQECPMDLATLQEKIFPEDWQRAMKATLGGGDRYDMEYRLMRPTGEVRIVHSRGEVKRDASGRPYQIFGTGQDITDRRRAEQRLRESEAYLAEAQRLSQTGSWAWNPVTGDIRYWSEMCYCVLGFDPAGPLPPFEEFVHRVHPDDQAALRERFDEAIRDKADFELDSRVVHPDKRIRDIHVVGHAVLDGLGNLGEFVGTVIDVTERKCAEEALKKSQLYLSEGQRLAHMGSWAFNPSGFFEYWSQELFKIYGLDLHKGAPTLQEYLAAVHPADRDFIAETIRRMHAEGSGCDVKKRIVRPDGEQRYIRCVGIPVIEDEMLKGFLGTAIDITEQELLTQELERQQAYLTEAQKLTHTGSWAYQPDRGEFLHCSDEYFRIYGLKPQVGVPTREQIRNRIHPEDRDRSRENRQKQFRERGELVDDYRVVLPDGAVRDLHTIGHPVLDENGKLVEYVGTTMDITDRKRAEQALQRSEAYLAEAQKLTHTGSWAWRVSDRKTVHLSEEWYRIYGFDPGNGAPSWEEYFERVHPEDRLKWKGIIERTIVEKADYDEEVRVLFPNGKVKWIHTVGHPVFSGAGDLEQFVGSSTDITELKSAEQEKERLRQLEGDLAHTNRVNTLGEMTASLAHEIKQPIAAAITSANSCIEWLAHEPPNLDRARAAAAKVDRYGNRAAEIIDRIRSFYKKSPPQRELVDVNGIVHELLTLLKGEAHRFSVTMRINLSTELPKIMVDRVQLQQVFMNLMLNAIEAMRDSGGELTVKSELQDGQLQFSVSDSGVGLPIEKMDQIFSAFFTTKPQGSGMGLAISRSIVESHGGQLWACANSGGGASFHFTLPLQITESSPLVA